MKLDGKVKGGLAWAGLVVILAVPAADMIFGKSDSGSAATAVSANSSAPAGQKAPALKPSGTVDPIQTASTSGDAAVDKFLQSGKKLPAYISDGDAVQPAAAAAPAKAPAIKAPAIAGPTTVAGAPAEAPPVPLPRSARPQGTQVAALPAAEEKPLVIDENQLQRDQAAVDRFPLSDSRGDVVTSDQLEEWDTGSLAEYLERKGLMTETSRRNLDRSRDPDGFYLDEVPNEVTRPTRELDFFLF